MLSEMRKYRLNLVFAHQYMAQVDETVQDAILGNAGTIIHPEFTAHDLVNLPNYHIYLKLMIDGVASRPFSRETIKGGGS